MKRVVAKRAFVFAALLGLTGCVLDSDDVCGPNMFFVAEASTCVCIPHAVEEKNSCHMCADDEVASGGVCKPAAECAVEGACPDAQ